MAELLVFVKPVAHADPLKDAQRYKKGDVVTVQADGFAWGVYESKSVWLAAGNAAEDWPGHFALVKITGADPDKVRTMLSSDEDADGSMTLRRLNKLDIDATPSQIKNKIGTDYEVTVTVNQIQNYIKRKSDGTVLDLGL